MAWVDFHNGVTMAARSVRNLFRLPYKGEALDRLSQQPDGRNFRMNAAPNAGGDVSNVGRSETGR